MLVQAHLIGPQDDEAVKMQVLTFRELDEHGLGVVSEADIATALRAQGLEVPPDLRTLCERADLNQHGSVNLVEYVT